VIFSGQARKKKYVNELRWFTREIGVSGAVLSECGLPEVGGSGAVLSECGLPEVDGSGAVLSECYPDTATHWCSLLKLNTIFPGECILHSLNH